MAYKKATVRAMPRSNTTKPGARALPQAKEIAKPGARALPRAKAVPSPHKRGGPSGSLTSPAVKVVPDFPGGPPAKLTPRMAQAQAARIRALVDAQRSVPLRRQVKARVPKGKR
jgi:hypothetical protein